jgi:hypothetical protein
VSHLSNPRSGEDGNRWQRRCFFAHSPEDHSVDDFCKSRGIDPGQPDGQAFPTPTPPSVHAMSTAPAGTGPFIPTFCIRPNYTFGPHGRPATEVNESLLTAFFSPTMEIVTPWVSLCGRPGDISSIPNVHTPYIFLLKS